jgi:hypothetical protein
MWAARRFIVGVVFAAVSAVTVVAARAETLSVTYSAHRAYRGTDHGFFAGLVLSGQNLFTVDLGAVVGKYVGETEKNLDTVFEGLGLGEIVLFFDEADALFGKRSDVKDAHDRFAENFIVLNPSERTWRGLIVLGPEDGVREDGVYELSGRYGDLIVTPVPAPPGLSGFISGVALLCAASLRAPGAATVRRPRSAVERKSH